MVIGKRVHGEGDPRVARTSKDPYGPSDPNSTGVYFTPKEFQYSNAGSELSENNCCVCVGSGREICLCYTWL